MVKLMDARIVNQDLIIDVKGLIISGSQDTEMIRTFRVLELFQQGSQGIARVKFFDGTIDIPLESMDYEVAQATWDTIP